VRHKNTQQTTNKFFYHNWKKSNPILISFNTNISDTTGHQITLWFFTLSVSALPGGKTKKILHFNTLVLLLNQNNTQNKHFVYIFIF